MIKYLLNQSLLSMKKRYDYDVTYMQDILRTDLGAFMKFMAFQTMSTHKGNLPVEALYAARIRAIIWDDCGPCTQLIVNMAVEANVDSVLVKAIVDRDLEKLPSAISLVVRFTELVLAHNPEADELRQQIIELWGEKGLITIAYGICSTRVYPALKYTLGHGKTCSRVVLNDEPVVPKKNPQLVGSHHD
ncbi:hypothetical protein ACSLBF_09265 [Pseudoalteromonas sp. T1lg65]|uniref:hypothetical protein n=1 Tax=Pseudoalteromonas sp. T1lg65 TaxID=2077101 RepID=UPI003F7ADABD